MLLCAGHGGCLLFSQLLPNHVRARPRTGFSTGPGVSSFGLEQRPQGGLRRGDLGVAGMAAGERSRPRDTALPSGGDRTEMCCCTLRFFLRCLARAASGLLSSSQKKFLWLGFRIWRMHRWAWQPDFSVSWSVSRLLIVR